MNIKILAGNQKHIQLWPMMKKPVRNKLSDLGVNFVNKNPDMILYHTYNAPKPLKEKALKSTIPIMILERIASARILSRRYISQDNVIGVLKSTVYRDLNIDNEAYEIETIDYPEKKFKNNYHCRLIYDNSKIKCKYHAPKIKITKDDFEKVELWYNFGCYEMMSKLINIRNPDSRMRPLDVGFIGTTKYGPHSDPITYHRQLCMKQANKLRKCKSEIVGRRLPGKKTYIDNIANSKVGLSPWGLGEKCYRDFEVIFGGGILLKPDTSFVLDWTDTYNPKNKYYIPCEINFSNMQEKVNMIKRDWKKLKDFRMSARQRLIDQCWDSEKIATHVYNTFKKCSKRIK